MQIRFFIFEIFFLMFLNVYSKSFNALECDSYLKEIEDRPYICYNFGISEPNTVIIVKGDSICEALVYDRINCKAERFNVLSTPILEWAFNDMIYEIQDAQYDTSNKYQPYFYQIVFVDGDDRTLITSSYRYVVDNEVLILNINKLKTFLVGLWIETLYNSGKLP